MFKVEQDPTFEATVVLDLPGGRSTPIRVTYHYLVGDAYQGHFERTRNSPAHEFLGGLVADWATEDDPKKRWEGMPMKYSPEALENLLKAVPRVAKALTAHYNHEVLGFPLGN